jgi:hypothetical protein
MVDPDGDLLARNKAPFDQVLLKDLAGQIFGHRFLPSVEIYINLNRIRYSLDPGTVRPGDALAFAGRIC